MAGSATSEDSLGYSRHGKLNRHEEYLEAGPRSLELTSKLGIDIKAEVALDLDDLENFRGHPWVTALEQPYEKYSMVANAAAQRIVNDLEQINSSYVEEHARVAFTTIEARVKTFDSVLGKIRRMCLSHNQGVTQDTIRRAFFNISDLCDVRFSCPYLDDVEAAVNQLIRPKLGSLGYGVKLDSLVKTRFEEVPAL